MIPLIDTAQLPEALKAMRTSREETRRSLAEAAGMLEQQYGAYEHGRRTPAVEQLLRIADAAEHDVILVPRELVAALGVLGRAIPAEALTALAALALIPREDTP